MWLCLLLLNVGFIIEFVILLNCCKIVVWGKRFDDEMGWYWYVELFGCVYVCCVWWLLDYVDFL